MIISSIQIAAKSIYHPINQRITQVVQTADWKEKTMLTGLVISVCCAVITFFTQTAFICGAFTLLSGVCSLGSIYIRHYENLKKMGEYIKTLQEENQHFQTNNQALQEENQRFQTNNQALQAENQHSQANNQALQEENQRFQASNQALQANNQGLESLLAEQKDSVTQITFENEKLKSEVTKLTIHTNYLKDTSQELVHSVEDLRVNLVVLGPSVLGSQEVEKKLRTFSITMEKQQTVAKNLMEFISKLSVKHSDQLENQKEIIKQLQSLQRNDTILQKIKELDHIRQQISSGHDKLADILTKAAQTSTQLSTLQEQYSAENTRLQELQVQLSTLRVQYDLENTRLQATRQELSDVSSALQSVLSEYKSLLAEQKGDKAALASQIDRLQKLYAELNWHNSGRDNGLH